MEADAKYPVKPRRLDAGCGVRSMDLISNCGYPMRVGGTRHSPGGDRLLRLSPPPPPPRFDTNPPPTLAVDDLDMRLIVFDLDLHLLPL